MIVKNLLNLNLQSKRLTLPWPWSPRLWTASDFEDWHPCPVHWVHCPERKEKLIFVYGPDDVPYRVAKNSPWESQQQKAKCIQSKTLLKWREENQVSWVALRMSFLRYLPGSGPDISDICKGACGTAALSKEAAGAPFSNQPWNVVKCLCFQQPWREPERCEGVIPECSWIPRGSQPPRGSRHSSLSFST